MISNTFLFIFGTIIFGTWIIGTFLEFKKMNDNPKDYEEKRNLNFTSNRKLDKE
jgi:hypothetical protein